VGRHLQLLWRPAEYQFRVLFWGIFGALVLRIFIFAGVVDRSVRLDPLRVRAFRSSPQ
jgi:hypothetical protein